LTLTRGRNANRYRCNATSQFVQNEFEIRESDESLRGRRCRTDRELSLLRATRDSISSHFKRVAKPTVKSVKGVHGDMIDEFCSMLLLIFERKQKDRLAAVSPKSDQEF
jgi:hypothetical protein